MKRILILIDSLVLGGAEKQAISLINNINDRKFFLALGYLNKKEDLLPQIKKEKRSRTLCFKRKFRFDPWTLHNLNLLVTKEHYDSILCINEYPMLYAYLAKILWRHKYNLITAIHHTIIRPGAWETIKNVLYRKILNSCDTVLFISKNQMDYWIKKYGVRPARSKNIYNGIDCRYFKDNIPTEKKESILREYNIDKRDVVLGSIAVLRPEKRHEDIISAAKLLRDAGLPVKVLFVGDGPAREYILGHARFTNLANHVFITGFRNDVRPYLSVIDCIIIASDAVETFSLAALEAMAMSKPVIITDIGGASEMVQDGFNGYLYKPRNVEMLVEKIRMIVENNLFEMMGTRSRIFVEENFTLEKMVSEYEKLFCL